MDALSQALGAAQELCCRATGAAPGAYKAANQAVTARLFEAVEAGAMPWAEARGRIYAETLAALGRPDPDLAREIELHFGQTQLRELRIYDDAAALLKQLKGRLPMGLVTNGASDHHPESQRSKVDFFGLERYLGAVIISDAVGVRKPGRGIFQAALKELGVAPERTLFVGDNLRADIGGANAAGLVSVWLDRHGKAPEAYPAGAVPAHVVGSLDEVPGLLGL